MNRYRLFLTVFLSAFIAFSTAEAQIVCDSFKILADLKGNVLKVSLQTDLPGNTEIMVDIDRQYFQVGSTSTYPHPYLSEKSTVGEWREMHTVVLDSDKWLASLRSDQMKMSRLGIGYQVSFITNKVRVSIVVPIFQSDPRFGAKNVNLTGNRVNTEGLRVVRDEVVFDYPMDSAIAMKPVPSLNPDALDVGRSYILSKETPLMPEVHPADPLAALKRMKKIPSRGIFTIQGMRKDGSVVWYRVVALNPNKGKIGSGWINSTALIGQDLNLYEGE
jgi:hypothetical protein